MIHARHAVFTSLGVALLAVAASAATVSGDDLAHCAGIASPSARLACYDTLAHRAPDAVTGPAASRSAISSAPAAPLAAVAPTAPTASPAVIAASPEDPKSFGLSAVQRHVAVVGPKEESGRIVSLAANQAGHSTIVLDSGQTWTVLDNDGWLSTGDQIIIKRAALGSYLLMTQSHRSYRVHRVQ